MTQAVLKLRAEASRLNSDARKRFLESKLNSTSFDERVGARQLIDQGFGNDAPNNKQMTLPQ